LEAMLDARARCRRNCPAGSLNILAGPLEKGMGLNKHVVGLSARSYEREGLLKQIGSGLELTDGGEVDLENGLRRVFCLVRLPVHVRLRWIIHVG
jgi:hypothetical protein